MSHEATVEGLGVSMGEAEVPVVLLSARDEVLPIFISADQAKSIQHALDGRPFDRPLTHDLFIELLTEFGGAIDRIRIDDLTDNTFLAKIDAEQYVSGDRSDVIFDARPSDAIAIAVRVDCPIFITDEVLDNAGRSPEEFELQE
ncbi:MAG: bifunctional nuclease family protein [Natronomonas sp.]